MKKYLVIFLIISLISFTAIVKNSTKRVEDEIFTLKENIRSLKKDFNNIKLEHEYLSSADKLLEFHRLYFDDQLVKKNIQEIKIINKDLKKSKIKKFKLIND